jgi:hypothetical protein
MSLLINFITLLGLWRPLFCKQQLFERIRALAIGFLGVIGRRTLTNVSIFLGYLKKGYEANCAVFSRRKWEAVKLFDPLLKEALKYLQGPYICVAADDMTLKKTGKRIKNASWRRDPLSPPFHVNFLWGLRFLQFSLLLNSTVVIPSRAIPIDFIEAPVVKKPKKKASKEEWKAYEKAKKEHNLSNLFVKYAMRLKDRLITICGETRKLLMVCDASFCNRICMAIIEGIEVLARCKKNAKLCFKYVGSNKRRKYGQNKFTPEDIRRDKSMPWKRMVGFYGGKPRVIKYKELNHVLWQGGTKTRPLKLIVLAPTPYRKRKREKLYYRQPAYLLCTDVEGDVEILIQCYLNRWQIEVNHREEKSLLGLGEAQVWNDKSIERQPSFHIAVYSALLLAARKTYQDKPNIDFDEPKWRRKKPKRLTFRAMMGLMRAEIIEFPEILQEINIKPIEIAMLLKKAA